MGGPPLGTISMDLAVFLLTIFPQKFPSWDFHITRKMLYKIVESRGAVCANPRQPWPNNDLGLFEQSPGDFRGVINYLQIC